MTLHQYDNLRQYTKKDKGDGYHTNAVPLDWYKCVVFYNNLHRFTRLVCAVGLFPKLDDVLARRFVPSISIFRKALEGDTKARKKAKALLVTITKDEFLNLQRKQIGIYVRKVHMQEFLQEKTLLLPLLVYNWVYFVNAADLSELLWKNGYMMGPTGANNSLQQQHRVVVCGGAYFKQGFVTKCHNFCMEFHSGVSVAAR